MPVGQFPLRVACTAILLFASIALPDLIAQESQAPAPSATAGHPWSGARELAPGILFHSSHRTEPGNLVIHAVRIDSAAAGLEFHTTGRIADWENGRSETRRQTVRQFVHSLRGAGIPVVVAVNADAFSLKTAFDREDPCNLSGLAVADGVLVSDASSTPSLIVSSDGGLRIETLNAGSDLTGIEVAVSGFALCLDRGKVLEGGPELHPRTGFGLSADNRYLFLVAIDGRQPLSEGATTRELGTLMKQFGAETAINMDGGGSTTLVFWDESAGDGENCQLLNVPVGNGRKWRSGETGPFLPSERTNGNNFGISVLAK